MKTKDEKKEYDRLRYLKNREKILNERKIKYFENKEKENEYCKKYRKEHTCYFTEYYKQYYNNKKGKSIYLLKSYKRRDKATNRGECTLTPEWIIENILNSKCIYCGETDWKKLGCDRINNDKPHTPENVVCSCGKCNKERNTKSFEEFLKMKRG